MDQREWMDFVALFLLENAKRDIRRQPHYQSGCKKIAHADELCRNMIPKQNRRSTEEGLCVLHDLARCTGGDACTVRRFIHLLQDMHIF